MKKIICLFCFVLTFLFVSNFVYAEPVVDENNYLRIQRVTERLHSRLAKQYNGYEYEITNKYTMPITIQHVSLWGNANAKVAYLSVKRTSSEAIDESRAKARDIALQTLSLSLVGNLLATPFIVVSNNIGNSSANKEAEAYDKRPYNSFIMQPDEKIIIKTMAMKKRPPSMKVTYKNPITDENMNIEIPAR